MTLGQEAYQAYVVRRISQGVLNDPPWDALTADTKQPFEDAGRVIAVKVLRLSLDEGSPKYQELIQTLFFTP